MISATMHRARAGNTPNRGPSVPYTTIVTANKAPRGIKPIAAMRPVTGRPDQQRRRIRNSTPQAGIPATTASSGSMAARRNNPGSNTTMSNKTNLEY
jgi:hypothetical protein